MAKLTVNIGSSANDRTGDNLRTAFNKLNSNFDEIYLSVDTLTSQVATITGSGTSNSASGNTIVGDIQGSVIAEDSTVLVDGVGGAIDASNLTGALPAIDGSALTGVVSAFSDLTGTPTTIAGYGISDAYTKAEVDSSIASVTAGHFDFNITGDDSTVRTVTSGSTLQITGGTAITTASDVDGNITINGVAQDFAFSSLTGTPTTLAGYGITDAATLAAPAFTGAVDFTGATSVDFTSVTVTGLASHTETDPVVGAINGIVKADGAGNISAAVAGTDYLTTVAFADLTGKPTTVAGYGITDAFDGAFGSLSGTPTTLAGYGITDAATLNNMAPTGAVDFTGATSVDFTGTTITALDSSGLTKPIDLDDNEEVRFGTDNDMRIYHSGTTGNIDNNTGSLIIDGSTVRIQDGALANTAISAANGIATLYHTNTAVLNTTAGGIKIEKGVLEKFATTNSATGVTALDCSTGHVHYLTGASGDITANFTNLNLTVEYATNITVIINQGATPYEVTAVQIGGAAQTINWQGGVAPTGNANGIDSFSFTILNDGGAYVVLGQMVDFT